MNKQVEDKTFGDLVLVCGDLHIPLRRNAIPEKILNLLTPNKIQHVICTGNVGNKDTLEFLKNLSPNFHVVKGEYDEGLDIQSDHKGFNIGQWRFSLLHGHQVIPWGDEEVLANHGREQDADVTISGHTHQVRVSKLDKKTFLNPGSMTGAYGPLRTEVEPTFLVLEIMGNELGIYQYTMLNQELQIAKVVISK